MVWGKNEEKLRAQQTQSGKVVAALQRKPLLHWYLQELMQAFLLLNHRRQYGMAMLPFLPESIIAHGTVLGWSEDSEFYYRCMLSLDDLYMEKYAEKEDKRRKADAAKNKTAPKRGR